MANPQGRSAAVAVSRRLVKIQKEVSEVGSEGGDWMSVDLKDLRVICTAFHYLLAEVGIKIVANDEDPTPEVVRHATPKLEELLAQTLVTDWVETTRDDFENEMYQGEYMVYRINQDAGAVFERHTQIPSNKLIGVAFRFKDYPQFDRMFRRHREC